MSTMNISLPDALKSFVDEQVSQRGYATSSEYVRELIRRDQDRLQLRGLLLQGASSAPGAPADATYFQGLRDRVAGDRVAGDRVRGDAKAGARG
jgi:antitoxin ParD1/3/4